MVPPLPHRKTINESEILRSFTNRARNTKQMLPEKDADVYLSFRNENYPLGFGAWTF